MSRRSLIPALLCAVPLLLPACDSGGSSSGNGGSQAGGTAASGGTTPASGGSGAGGTTTAAGGTTTLSGGTTAAGGAVTGTGGATPGTGGKTSGTGGSSSGTGGRTSGTGGSTSGTGGSATAGTTSGTGGARNGGATSAAGATGNGGATAAGGRTGAGGATGAGGSTGATNEVWVSPTGNDDTGTGTKDAPLFSICWDDSDNSIKKGACYKLCPVGTGCTTAGGTIWVMDGTYKYKATQKMGSSKNGTASAPFNVFAVAGAKPVLDFSALTVEDTSRGIQVSANYWHIKGLTVTKAGDTGIFVMGSNNTIEQCIAHHNQDAGIVVGVNSDVSGSGKNNLFLNCDSYQNNDEATKGENADGFGAKKSSGGTGNIFRGCRAWDNADDGFDFYAWDSPITVENCWAMSQAKTTSGSNSDGNGFKLGGNDVSAAHILKDLYATDNNYASSNCGFTNNNNPAAMTCTGKCASWGNGTAAKGVSGVGTTAPGSATAAKMIAAPRNADGSLPDISSL
jgi:pectate disaccharide-lyase